MAAIVDGRTMKIICIRKNICSYGKNNLLFLPSNMAAVQNLYWAVLYALCSQALQLLKEHPSYKDDEEIQGDPCIIYLCMHSINNISKFLAHDNDFPAFWLVP